MKSLMSGMPSELTILGIEPELSFEWKLAIYDAKIANNIETGNLEAVGRLIEMREAIIEERFKFTSNYIDAKKKLLKELEPEINNYIRIDNHEGARRLQFEKYRKIFQLQERFLARNYPFKAHVKERLKKWNLG